MIIDLSRSAEVVAQNLIGCELVFTDVAGARGGVIIETEAYTADDPASHSFSGRTTRNLAMFMPAGTIYVYQVYGIHYCLNIVCGAGDGQAVLIRALKPTLNLDLLRANRPGVADSILCNGPARLVQALGITKDFNQKHMDEVK